MKKNRPTKEEFRRLAYEIGEKVFVLYENIIHSNIADFVVKQIDLKKNGSIMAQFSISVY